jgi:hypothetical protein
MRLRAGTCPEAEINPEDALETPEVHRPHSSHGGGLPRWLELVIAVTALVTSVSSIAIAVHHGHTMEKLVQANSFPYMRAGYSVSTPKGEDVLSLDLLNRGVGPAHEKSLRVKVDGRYVKSFSQFVAASLGPEQAAAAEKVLDPLHDGVPTRFIPGGQSQFVFSLAKTPQNAVYWDALAKAQSRWGVEFCYCSVFDECWRVRSKWNEPEPVKQCSRDETVEFMP